MLDFKTKMHQIHFRLGFRPRPHWRANCHPPNPYLDLGWPTTKDSGRSKNEAAAVFGLRISWPKTKIQNVGSGPQPSSILVDGNPVDSVSTFTYLGSL